LQLLDDAKFMLERGGRTRSALYLAGYTVECMLKALILSSVPPRTSLNLRSARALRTHDYDRLKTLYLSCGGPAFPKEVARDFLTIGDWDTEVRYRPTNPKYAHAAKFLQAVERIAKWADGRL
jgi:HEPN domain-containing protein